MSKHAKRSRKRGIAIVAVMIAIAITLVITNEFGTSTNIDLFAAANYRDQMRAHFLARSAQNIGELIIRVQQRLDNDQHTRGKYQITDYTDLLLPPFCGSPDEVRTELGPLADQLKGIGAEVGTCGFDALPGEDGKIGTDDNKININCANNDQAWQTIKAAIDALMFFPGYDPVFTDNDAEGWHRDRQMQAAALIDYVDSDSIYLRERGTTEDYGYDSLKDRYYPKNNYIDTPDELKLVRGVDDRWWSLFGNAFTAYGGCKINISLLSNRELIAAVLFLSAKNANDPVLLDPKRLFALADLVAKAREMGEVFSNINDFINFVKDPAASVAMLAGTGEGTIAGSAASAAINAGIPELQGGQVGLELDPVKLGQIATTGPRRTYRLRAYGEIDRKQTDAKGQPVFPPVRSVVTGVWDTKVVPQNVRRPPVPNGAWVYEKEE